MQRIFNSDEVKINDIEKSQWTLIIPAAGKGTRLQTEMPKALFPINGNPMVAHIAELFKDSVSEIVVVVSPEAEMSVKAALKDASFSKSLKFAIQEKPLGMGHAIFQAQPFVNTKNVAVCWVDQVTLKKSTIVKSMAVFSQEPLRKAVFPTVKKSDPYINCHRNADGRIVEIQQKRENEIKVKIGENDCGVFFFSTNDLFKILKQELDTPKSLGKSTGEVNLLPLIPKLEGDNGELAVVRLKDIDETLGVNDRREAERAEQILRSRGPQAEL